MRDASLSDFGSEYRPKPVPPKPDCLVADLDPALGQKILDVAQRQRVSDVHHARNKKLKKVEELNRLKYRAFALL